MFLTGPFSLALLFSATVVLTWGWCHNQLQMVRYSRSQWDLRAMNRQGGPFRSLECVVRTRRFQLSHVTWRYLVFCWIVNLSNGSQGTGEIYLIPLLSCTLHVFTEQVTCAETVVNFRLYWFQGVLHKGLVREMNSEKAWNLVLIRFPLCTEWHGGAQVCHFTARVNERIAAFLWHVQGMRIIWGDLAAPGRGLSFCQMIVEMFPLCPVEKLGVEIFMLLLGFGSGSAYTAKPPFAIISTSNSAGGSLGIFRQKWLNWISAQTQYLNGFYGWHQLGSCHGKSSIHFWALEFRSPLWFIQSLSLASC